jgi:predicted DNA-binding transcriptional regulator YafY
MTSRSTRLLELLIALQAQPRFTVAELAERFDVSRRTMLRDLHALSEMGVPLSATPGPGGGYSLIMRRRLFPLSLSVDEAIGIILSYEALLAYSQSPFAAGGLSTVTKVRNALPAEILRELDLVREHVVVNEPRPEYDARFLPDLLRASLEGAHLRIVYDSRSGTSERVIFPFGLVASNGFWYCACHDYRRGINISLRADRVRSLERVEGFDRPPGSLHDWFERRLPPDVRFLPFRARVTRKGAHTFEFNLLFGEVTVGEDGTAVVERELPDSELEYYADRLLVLGTELTVESPAQLIGMMRERAEAIARMYRSSTHSPL